MAYYYYKPSMPFTITSIDSSFPEHHWPLENMFHKIGHNIQDVAHQFANNSRHPRADIRETVESFYIDIELPGLDEKGDIALKWTNSRTLCVEATLTMPLICSGEDTSVPSTRSTAKERTVKSRSDKGRAPQHPIHYLNRERHCGAYTRAFYFNVGMIQTTLEANLKHALLRISIEKKLEEQMEHKEVEIEHHDI
jgi:HSP20 family molecular chaperone IbpA